MLPKINHPIYTFEVPSSKQKIKFRPFLVKEEKILLLVSEENNEEDMLFAIQQILQNCCLTEGFSADEITIFDAEYLFLKLRSVSVNNLVKLSYQDFEDNEIRTFEIDLNEVNFLKRDKEISNKIKINDDVIVEMKYPNINDYQETKEIENQIDKLVALIAKSIVKIHTKEKIIPTKDIVLEEMISFVESFSKQQIDSINEFFSNMPIMSHEINYLNNNGKEIKIKLMRLADFFLLR